MDHLASPHFDSPQINSAESSGQSFMSDFAEATHDLLMAEAPVRRAEAALRLASLGKPLASPYLIAALADSAWEVRQAAAQSLGCIGDDEAIEPLQAMLAGGNQDALLQQEISRAIESITSRAANQSSVSTQADIQRVSVVEAPPAEQLPVHKDLAVMESALQSEAHKQRLAVIEANRKDRI